MAPLFCVQLLADAGAGEVIAFIVALLYGAVWLFRKMAENKEQQRRAADRQRDRQDASEEDEEDDEDYAADDQQVRRFLETLGVQAEARPVPPRPPQPTRPATVNAPGRPPQRRLQPEPEPPVLAAAPVAPEPPPVAPRPRARPAQKQTEAQQLEPEQEYAFGSPAARPDHPETPQTSAAHRHVAAAQKAMVSKVASAADRLALPQLTPLQRAIVLSDILGRRPGGPGR